MALDVEILITEQCPHAPPAILRGLFPRHFLFLCVANSARSQMAEEIGIDPKGQRSKGMEEVEGGVDCVITLCAEEVCPAWLGQARRVHWGLPDPAGVQSSEEERLDAFREVRDELRRRLAVLFEL